MKTLALLLLSVSVSALATSGAYLFIVTAQAERTLPKLIDARAEAIQVALMAEVDVHAVMIEQLVDHRTGQVLAIANGAIQRADARTIDALAITANTSAIGLAEIDAIRTDLNGQLGTFNTTLRDAVQPVEALARRYTLIPDQLAAIAQPSREAIEPEITCRHADGSGYGGCWHSRITGMMGEAVNIGGVFTQHFPALSTSITGISVDAHTFTSRAVAPRGFWGNFKDILGTSSGVVRAGAAAGIF